MVSDSVRRVDTDGPRAVHIRMPERGDAIPVWHLVRCCPPLDINSAYCYLLLCSHLRETCAVAESATHGMVGFLSALTTPGEPRSLFIWQIAVAPAARQRGVAGALLKAVLGRPVAAGFCFIEATAGPNNVASRALFRRLADERGVPLRIGPGFAPSCFPDAHEAEDWLRVGPLH